MLKPVFFKDHSTNSFQPSTVFATALVLSLSSSFGQAQSSFALLTSIPIVFISLTPLVHSASFQWKDLDTIQFQKNSAWVLSTSQTFV